MTKGNRTNHPVRKSPLIPGETREERRRRMQFENYLARKPHAKRRPPPPPYIEGESAIERRRRISALRQQRLRAEAKGLPFNFEEASARYQSRIAVTPEEKAVMPIRYERAKKRKEKLAAMPPITESRKRKQQAKKPKKPKPPKIVRVPLPRIERHGNRTIHRLLGPDSFEQVVVNEEEAA